MAIEKWQNCSLNEVRKMSEQQNSYRYLEWRPHRWRKTP
ncbi:MAG: hypothetical protein REDVDVYQ_000791, partial [Candidatus Fervidibacter sp.]